MKFSEVWFKMALGNKEKLIIIGEGETAQIAYEYFTSDTNFQVTAFSAEKAFIKKQTLFNLPIVPFEELEKFYSPNNHKVFVAVSFGKVNSVRSRLFNLAKEKGYALCTYISPKALVARHTEVGENCFIFENAVIQQGAKIGDNVLVWSASVIGHRSVIRDNCFLSYHVAISGFCDIGENCFFGVNSCTAHNIKVAKNCIVGAGAVVIGDTQEGKVYVGNPAKALPNKDAQLYISGKETI